MSMPRPNWKLQAEHLARENERLRAALAKSCREDRAEFLGGCFHTNMAQAEIKVSNDEIERLRKRVAELERMEDERESREGWLR